MYAYAADHDGRFPPDIDALIEAGNAAPKMLLCPSSGAAPGDIDTCCEYIAGQGPDSYAGNVLVFEKSDWHTEEGGNVLFVDGHVEFIEPYARVRQLVEQTRERLAK